MEQKMTVNIKRLKDRENKERFKREVIAKAPIFALILKKFNANIVKISPRRKLKIYHENPFITTSDSNREKWFYFLEDCPQLRVKKGMYLPYRKDIEDKLVDEYEISFKVVAFSKSKKSKDNPDGKIFFKQVEFE